jgi:hypothetical protein
METPNFDKTGQPGGYDNLKMHFIDIKPDRKQA